MSSDSFAALPEYLQRRIDKAFDQSGASNGSNPVDSGGGFIADGGGFLIEDSEPPPTQIALSAVPAALQRLDLPPDDEQILLVLKNAASGWRSSTNRPEEIGEEEGAGLYVSRDDWRSVCAVLLEHRAEEYEDSEGTGPGADSDGERDEDEYQGQDEPDAESDEDSDEYMEEGPSTSRRRTRSAKNTRRRSPSSSSTSSVSPRKSKPLTARQKKTCLETYALFFPTVSEEELPDQRITLKDIQRLTKLIGDKLKGDEVCPFFSSLPPARISS